MKKITIYLCLLLFSSCLKDEPLKRSYEGFTPIMQNDDWEISTPGVENMNPEVLEQAVRKLYWQDGFLGARALLVFRNGKLVAEVYPRDLEHINEISNVQSITKSFTAILAGIAMEKGNLDTLNTPLYDIYPTYFDDDENKRSITIEHALTMTSGLEFEDDPNFLEFIQHEGNSAEYVLHQPLNDAPGTKFYYSDGSPQLIVKAIEENINQSLEAYADEHLFAPLGIAEYQWEKAKDGTNYGAFGLFLTPRDIGKFGQLLLNNGIWNGQQIVRSDWIEKATMIKPDLIGGGGQYFGYYLWLNPANGAYAARGNGGQFVYIIPEQDLVIVYTASPSISEYLNYEQDLVNTIINSCY